MKRKMAVVQKAEDVRFEEFGIPALGPHDVLLKVSYSAVCGSDLHLYRDIHPFVKAPSTIGHELSGRVVETGSAVTGVQKGDLVVPEPILVCGECAYCKSGDYHMCRDVSYQYRRGQAGFTDFFVVDERWAHKVPQQVGDKSAAIVEPLSVAVHGVRKAGDLLAKTVVVIGAGAIGTLAAHVCRLSGAARVFIVDLNPKRLELSARLSGAQPLNAKEQDVVAFVREQTDGLGCDVVIECTGAEVCAVQALDMVCKMGTIVQLGIPSRNFKDYPYARLLSQEVTLRGSQGYCFDFERAIALLSSGRIDLAQYITHEFPSAQIADAFALAANPDTDSMKILLHYE